MLIYFLMALDLPAWALKAIDRIRRGFLWKGRKGVRGGHCLIAWPKVTRPCYLGGLGISHYQFFGWALRLRWLWLQKTKPDKAWSFLLVKAPHQVQDFFAAAVVTVSTSTHAEIKATIFLKKNAIASSLPSIWAQLSICSKLIQWWVHSQQNRHLSPSTLL